ncbi:hypothetical protein P167DRAFT_538589 [Morchella conica CCBAS932]|uniref:Uncharacterized protein n=1 Tax=Morchella conica CCBAS932 TaxID=1392247 RepID=A0A3N4KIY8_9PEZI|nr:hypothetical protein P167DRAFT_538589 [Morchella conica CCBAS932]
MISSFDLLSTLSLYQISPNPTHPSSTHPSRTPSTLPPRFKLDRTHTSTFQSTHHSHHSAQAETKNKKQEPAAVSVTYRPGRPHVSLSFPALLPSRIQQAGRQPTLSRSAAGDGRRAEQSRTEVGAQPDMVDG